MERILADHTDEQAITEVRAGRRAFVELSLYNSEREAAPHVCDDRVIVCADDVDIVECPRCGKQRITRCHFDDDYN